MHGLLIRTAIPEDIYLGVFLHRFRLCHRLKRLLAPILSPELARPSFL